MTTLLAALVIAVVTAVALHRDIARAVERRRVLHHPGLVRAFRQLADALATTGVSMNKATYAAQAFGRILTESGDALAGNTSPPRRAPRYEPRHRR